MFCPLLKPYITIYKPLLFIRLPEKISSTIDRCTKLDADWINIITVLSRIAKTLFTINPIIL